MLKNSSRYMMRVYMGATLLLAGCVAQSAETPVTGAKPEAVKPEKQKPLVLKVWNGNPPNFVATAGPEIVGAGGRIENISVPTIEVYLPEKSKANGVAFVYCPGGGYHHLGGLGVMAERFVPEGIAVIDLKYRTHPPAGKVAADVLADAQRAMRLVRSRAKEWNIDPQKIGIVGTSAGANAALNLATHFDAGDAKATDSVDRQSSRPDFVALLSFWPYLYSTKSFPITAASPPTFLLHAENDRTALVDKAKEVASLLKEVGVPVELNLYPTGGHGISAIGRGPAGKWPQKFLVWLNANKFMELNASSRELTDADFLEIEGGKVSASSEPPRRPATLVTDKNVATFWVSGGPVAGVGPSPDKPEWIQLAFDTPPTASAIKVTGRAGYGPKQCLLQVSDDGKNFRTIHEFTIEDGVADIVPFAPTKSVAFRLVVQNAYDRTKPNAPRSVQICEIALLKPKTN